MVLDPIPEEVERFLGASIDGLDQLEILRLLGDSPSKEWGTQELAKEMQAAAPVVAAHLAALLSRGLVTRVSPGAEATWRHGASTPGLEAKVGSLLQTYRQRPVTLIKLVYAQAANGLRAFSDAFRIRKED